jgi:hypothetical protein
LVSQTIGFSAMAERCTDRGRMTSELPRNILRQRGRRLVVRKVKDGGWMRRRMEGWQGGEAEWMSILEVSSTQPAFHSTSRHPSD